MKSHTDTDRSHGADASECVDFSLNALRPIVEAHPVCGHPFITRFRESSWSREQVRLWTEQQFYFSISLPSAFAALYARVPDFCWRQKRPLVELLQIEAWGSRNARCHSHHFLELCAFLGIDVEALTSQAPKAYTQAYLERRFALCVDPSRPVGQGLAAIALGNEILNLHIYAAYREGIHKIPGCEDCPISYFDAHLSDEEADAEVFIRLFDLVVSSQTDFKAARAGLIELLDARVVFLDALCDDLQRNA